MTETDLIETIRTRKANGEITQSIAKALGLDYMETLNLFTHGTRTAPPKPRCRNFDFDQLVMAFDEVLAGEEERLEALGFPVAENGLDWQYDLILHDGDGKEIARWHPSITDDDLKKLLQR